MNFGKLGQWTILAAAVMILVTFAPESVLGPVKTVLSQVRMNNASAVRAEEEASGISISDVTNTVRKALK